MGAESPRRAEPDGERAPLLGTFGRFYAVVLGALAVEILLFTALTVAFR